jgi:hypothetical protein
VQDKDEVGQVQRLDQANVIPVGNAKKGLGQKNPFRIEIELDDQTYVLAAEDQQSMMTWVEGFTASFIHFSVNLERLNTKTFSPLFFFLSYQVVQEQE